MAKKTNILIIDGQGGGMGKGLTESIKQRFNDVTVTAVGTNAFATQAMLKAGADRAATGENAVIVACRSADIIVGPVGIAIADSLYGEISPKMAEAVGQSGGAKVLLPMNMCDILIAGVGKIPASKLIEDCIEKIADILAQKD